MGDKEELLEELFKKLYALPADKLKDVFDQMIDSLAKIISRKIILKGEKLLLAKGKVLFSEGGQNTLVSEKSKVFIILKGQLIARSQISETTNQTTFYGKGELVGVEMLISRLGEKTTNGNHAYYRETVMAIEDTELLGLTIQDSHDFFKYNPRMLVEQLRNWFSRSIQSEEKLEEVFKIAKGIETDLLLLGDFEQQIQKLISQGESSKLAGILISMKKQSELANSLFLELESNARLKESEIKKLRQELEGSREAIIEIMKVVPSKNESNAPAIDEKEIDSILSALGKET